MDYMATEDLKMSKYKNMLRDDISEFVVTSIYHNLHDMIQEARIHKIELERQSNLKRLTSI